MKKLRCPRCGTDKPAMVRTDTVVILDDAAGSFAISADALTTCDECLAIDKLSKFVCTVLYRLDHYHKDYGDGGLTSYTFYSFDNELEAKFGADIEIEIATKFGADIEIEIAAKLGIDYEPEEGDIFELHRELNI